MKGYITKKYMFYKKKKKRNKTENNLLTFTFASFELHKDEMLLKS